jgi:hypothetical protein
VIVFLERGVGEISTVGGNIYIYNIVYRYINSSMTRWKVHVNFNANAMPMPCHWYQHQ